MHAPTVAVPHSATNRHVVVAVATAVLGTPVLAYLAANDRAALGLPLLLLVPTFVLLARRPLAGIVVWLLIAQLVVQGSGGGERRVYWLVHRALPIGVLALILLAQMVGPHRRSLARLGLPELAMAGYVLATFFSILYHSDTVSATTIHLYDRVIAPMALYLIIRLIRPTARQLVSLAVALGAIVVTQTIIGLVAWRAPGVLPSAWLGRAGTRTVGSLRSPNVFGTTMLLGGVVLLHAAATIAMRRAARWLVMGLGMLAFFMVFMTFGRANWVAAVPVAAGLIVLHPRFAVRVVLVAALAVGVLVGSGTLTSQTELAQTRFRSAASEESALSRLPVVYASIRMFQEKPLTGWGYGDFDEHDRQFQVRVGNLVYPEKDHASHNLYLTILAEQGVSGFVLYLAPAAIWMRRTVKRWSDLPVAGFASRKLVGVLWLAALSHLIVNNFSNMRVVYGLGLWWLILALIASLVDMPRRAPSTAAARTPLEARASVVRS